MNIQANDPAGPATSFRVYNDILDLIRSGEILPGGRMPNERRLAEIKGAISAIAGRMSAYTGREMKWDWAYQASKLDLSPAKYEFGDLPVDPPAVPGQTKLV